MGDGGPNLRERNKARARAEIAASALELFGERGFEAVTVDQIVEHAGVSRRTFFRYFDSKEDALLADYPELDRRLADSLQASGQDDPLEAVRTGLHRMADWYMERSEAVLARSRVIRDAMHLAARNLEFLAQWESAISATLAERLTGADAPLVARTGAAALVGAFKAALTEWVRSSCHQDLHQLTDRALEVIDSGLRAQLRPRLSPPPKSAADS